MQRRVKVVGLGGSVARGSANLAAVRVALDEAERRGAQVEVLDISELALPLYVPGAEPPDGARRLAAAAASAHAMIWGSPLYHGTVSGAFKNAIDWLELLGQHDPPYLTDKAIGMLSTAGGGHALHAIDTMEQIARSLRAFTVPFVVPILQAGQAIERGVVRDANVERQLRTLGLEVFRAAERLAYAEARHLGEARPDSAEDASRQLEPDRRTAH